MEHYDVVIIGGSFAGLSAALTLARFKQKVVVIDSGQPCNRNAVQVHNLLMLDGEQREMFLRKANSDLEKYENIDRTFATANSLSKQDEKWVVICSDSQQYYADRILFSSGLTDVMPYIEGLEACWGKTVVHCPYCHAYEMKGRVGVLGNGLAAIATVHLLQTLGLEVSIFTNSRGFSDQYRTSLEALTVNTYTQKITALEHEDGALQKVVFDDGTDLQLDYLFIETETTQQSPIPQTIGCVLSPTGLIEVNEYQEASVPGIYAAGDCSNPIRYASVAMSDGTKAASFILQDLNSNRLKQYS